MPIDPNIALGYRGIEVPNPLAGAAQVAQIQNALQQQQLGGIQIQNALREQNRRKELEMLMSQFTPETPAAQQAAALQRKGFFGEARSLAQEAATMAKTQRETRAAELDAQVKQADIMGRLFNRESVTDQSSYDAARARAISLGLGTEAEIPTQYDPALVNRIQTASMSFKDTLAAKQRDLEVAARQTQAGAAASQAATAAAMLPIRERQAGATEMSAQAALERARAATTQTRDARVSPLLRLIQERDALPEDSPLRATYDAAIKRASEGSPPQIQVTIPPGEQAEQKGRGEALIKHETDVRAAADAARRSSVNLESAQAALDKGFRTGFGTEAKVAAANVLSSVFGMKDASKYATTGQLFNQTIMEQVLARQLQQKGVQTNQDAERIRAAGVQLGNTVEANQFMLDVARAQNQRSIAQDKFYRDWLKDPNNKGSLRGAEDAWLEAEGNSSLFDTPALQKYKSIGNAKPASAPTAPASPAFVDFGSLK